MLWFVGMGISGADSMPLAAREVVSKSDVVYLEQFTSPIADAELQKISEIAGGQFKTAKRWMVEDGKQILDDARQKCVALVSYGDPYVATTHIELRVRAIQEGIKTDSIHAASALTSLVGECGLHHYKIGRVATIMNDPKSMTTPYQTAYRNITEQSHTVLLLEYSQDQDFFLSPPDAISLMLGAEKGQKRRVFEPSTFAIVASRVGLESQAIFAGTLASLSKQDYGPPPHSIIVPGRLHFTESDALRVLARCLDEPSDNTKNTPKISHQMIAKYVPMVQDAIREIAPHYKDSEFCEVLKNAEHYIQDAQNFLEKGQDEVAILSIGYADGLIDALRIARGLEPRV